MRAIRNQKGAETNISQLGYGFMKLSQRTGEVGINIMREMTELIGPTNLMHILISLLINFSCQL